MLQQKDQRRNYLKVVEKHEFMASRYNGYLPYELNAVINEFKLQIDARPNEKERILYIELLETAVKWQPQIKKRDKHGQLLEDKLETADEKEYKLAQEKQKSLDERIRDRLRDEDMEPVVRAVLGNIVTEHNLLITSTAFASMQEKAYIDLVQRGALPPRRPVKLSKVKHETNQQWMERLVVNQFTQYIGLNRYLNHRHAGIEQTYWRYEYRNERLLINKKMLAAFILMCQAALTMILLRFILPDSWTEYGWLSWIRFNPVEINWPDLFLQKMHNDDGEEGLSIGTGGSVRPLNVRAMEHAPNMPGFRRVPVDKVKTLSNLCFGNYSDDCVVWYNRNLTEEQIKRQPAKTDHHRRKIDNLLKNPIVNVLNDCKNKDEFIDRYDRLPTIPPGTERRGYLLYQKVYGEITEPMMLQVPYGDEKKNSIIKNGHWRDYKADANDKILKHLEDRDAHQIPSKNLNQMLIETIFAGSCLIFAQQLRRAIRMSEMSAQGAAEIR